MKKLDLLSKTNVFSFEGAKNFKTAWGSVLTIGFGVVGIVLFILFSMDMFLRRNPQVIYSNEIDTSPEESEMDLDKFKFILAAKDPNTFQPFRDEQIMHFKYFQAGKTNGKGYRTSLASGPCNPEYLSDFPLTEELKSIHECLDPNEASLNFEGINGNSEFKYFKASIHKCVDEGCKPEEEVQKYTKGTSISVFFNNFQAVPDDFSSPMRPYMDGGEVIYISEDVYKLIVYTVSKVEVVTDEGYFYTDNKRETFWRVVSKKETFDFRQSDDGKMMEINFWWGKEKIVISRRYKKLQNVVAELSGILTFVRIILTNIAILLSNKVYRSSLESKIIQKNNIGLRIANNLSRGGAAMKRLTQSSKNKTVFKTDWKASILNGHNILVDSLKTKFMFEFLFCEYGVKEVESAIRTASNIKWLTEKENRELASEQLRDSRMMISKFVNSSSLHLEKK